MMNLVDMSRPLSEDVEICQTDLFSVICVKGEKPASTPSAPVSAQKTEAKPKKDEKPAEEDVFGDDDDLFAEDDGEAAKKLQEKLKAEAVARGNQKLDNARSLIVFEVKPFDEETDLESLAQSIKQIEHAGIQNWGQEHKLVPVAFGIKKLVISVVVFDNLICMDDIIDMINENYEDQIQSIDIQAMSKV